MKKFYNYSKFLLLVALSFVSSANAQCDISVTFSSTGYGDVTSWQLQDGSGTAVLTGGTYGFGYTDVQTTIGSNPPYNLVVQVNNSAWCDNLPNYSVTVGGSPDISGTVNVGCTNTQVTLPLSAGFVGCTAVQPPTPLQDPALPTCSAGTALTISGTPATNNVWYWQTSSTGTLTTNPYVGAYSVFVNGTYYARSLNTVSNIWSPSVSVTVSNMPIATMPLAPIAGANPACAPTGTTLTLDSPILGYEYYWQGTTVDGTSTANNASTPLAVTSTGTYTVAAFDPATQCWSPTIGTLVTVDTYIPAAPSASVDNFNICAGATTLEISATAPGGSASTNGSNATSTPIPDNNTTGISSTINISNIPAGSTITGITVGVNITHTWNSDLDIFLTGSNGTQIELSTDNGGSGDNYTNTIFSSAGVNPITGGVSPFTGTFLPEGNLTTLYSLGSGSWTLTVKDDTGGDFGTLLNWNISITYTPPASTISWYDAATAGNGVGTGTPLETVGTSVLSNPATFGTYEFYAGAVSGGCASSTRTLVTVNVSNTNAVLTPVNTSCNGANDGTFILGAVACGTEPFIYSLDGGATFGAIPTDLIAGTYSVIIEDDNGLQSSPISVVVGQPAVPSAITFTNVEYFAADVSWTTTGNETAWDIEYGPVGFTPGTGAGTIVTASASPYTITGLQPDTDYDVYITPVCGTSPQSAGPVVMSTNAGFLTYDNACPASGFVDISATGTDLALTDDGEAGITIPFSFSYQNQTINTMTVGNNGGVLLNTLTGNVGTGGNMTSLSSNYLFPWGDDLDDETGSVYWEVTGTAPNQTLIVQWDNSNNWSNGSGTVTFQLQIEEATGIIYFVYDDVEFGGGETADDYAGNADIGISGPTTDINVSNNNQTYLQNNTCVRFYNALCPNAVISTVTPAAEEVTLDWNAGLYGETEWTLIYGPAGFDPLTGGTTINVNTSDANIPGLTQLTEYDVYIYSECTIDSLTSGGLLVSFTTLPWCADPITLGGTTAVDSLFATWNFVPAVGAPQALSSFNLQYGPFGFDLYAGTNEVATDIDYADTVANAAWLAGGVYQLYVQAVCGTDTSNYSGPFTFVMPLTNDTVCGAEMLQVDGTVYTFNNTGATAAVGESAIVPQGTYPDGYNGTILPTLTWGSAFADGSNWYTFVAPASGSLWFSGQDENFFASQIAIYELTDCADFATFSLVAASDQTTPDIASKVAPYFTVCGLTPGATYYVLHDAWSNGSGGAPVFGQYSIKMNEIVLQAGAFADVINTCTGSTVNLFDGIAGYDNGGVWTAEVPSAGTGITDSLWNSAGLAYQLFNFEYRVTVGCAYDSIVAQVDVYESSNAGEDGTISVCRNEPYDLLSGLSGSVILGGNWFNSANQSIPSSSIYASSTAGSYDYKYVVGNGVCPNDTAVVTVNVDGNCDWLNIDEMYFSSMVLYPNVSTGLVYISNTGSTDVFSYEVSDMAGRLVAKKSDAINGSTTTSIDLTGKITGMYMIRVYNGNAEKVFKVVLQ
jgi:subtilisin-like proprotein convertase family protein